MKITQSKMLFSERQVNDFLARIPAEDIVDTAVYYDADGKHTTYNIFYKVEQEEINDENIAN